MCACYFFHIFFFFTREIDLIFLFSLNFFFVEQKRVGCLLSSGLFFSTTTPQIHSRYRWKLLNINGCQINSARTTPQAYSELFSFLNYIHNSNHYNVKSPCAVCSLSHSLSLFLTHTLFMYVYIRIHTYIYIINIMFSVYNIYLYIYTICIYITNITVNVEPNN